jgi:hypothetical protein
VSYGLLFTIALRSPGPIWRAGRRISEALALNKSDLDPNRGNAFARRPPKQRLLSSRKRSLYSHAARR